LSPGRGARSTLAAFAMYRHRSMFLNLSALLPHSVTVAATAVICNRQEAVLLRSLSSGQGILIAASLPSEM